MDAERSTGVAFVELVIVLVAVSILGSMGLRAYAALSTASVRLSARAAGIQATRATRGVLRTELSGGSPGTDWELHAPDSVRLRAFRGVATLCESLDDSTLVVRRNSSRQVDPAKDSVLVLDVEGRWHPVDLVAARPEPPCGAAPVLFQGRVSSVVERWRVRPSAPGPVLLRVFEAGSYHLTGGTLRYRRGSGGRQPLTAPALQGARFVDTLGSVRALVSLGPAAPRSLVLAPSR